MTFTTTSHWVEGVLQVHEQHVLRRGAHTASSDDDFAMRPWTSAELTDRLHRAGLPRVSISPAAGRSTPDRLFVIAARTEGAARPQ